MKNNKQRKLNQDLIADLSTELTITGLIFSILVIFSCYINDKVTLQKQLATTQEQLLEAKTIAVNINQELSSAYEMVESLNSELDKYYVADFLTKEVVRVNESKHKAK